MGDENYFLSESDGVVEVWDRGDVPGEAGQRTRLESAKIVGKMGDDHFHDFVWKGCGWFAWGTCLQESVISE